MSNVTDNLRKMTNTKNTNPEPSHIINRYSQLISKLESSIGSYRQALQAEGLAYSEITNIVDQLEDLGPRKVWVIDRSSMSVVKVSATLTFIIRDDSLIKTSASDNLKWRVDTVLLADPEVDIDSIPEKYAHTDVYFEKQDANDRLLLMLNIERDKIAKKLAKIDNHEPR